MIYRNVANLMTAAIALALLITGAIGTPVAAQQYSNSGCTTCSSCTGAINFSTQQPVLSPVVSNGIVTEVVGSTSTAGVALPAITYATSNGLPGVSQSAAVGTVTSIPSTYAVPLISSQPVSRITTTPIRSTIVSNYRAVGNGIGNVASGLAQMKAQRAASGGVRGHVGGGLGGARFEGVGWSNRSAQEAIQSCCYWGTRPTAQIGVSRGRDGFWYACVLYN